MTTGWAYSGPSPLPPAPTGAITLIEGVTFCICEQTGDITPGGQQGLFSRDTASLAVSSSTSTGSVLSP